MELPNTEVRNCDHESHEEAPARAVTLIRFAIEGEVKEFWGCLEHRTATDFGYVAPKSEVEQLASAAPKPPDEPPNQEVGDLDVSTADDDGTDAPMSGVDAEDFDESLP